jgi:RND family efflux transporter MFP subunit
MTLQQPVPHPVPPGLPPELPPVTLTRNLKLIAIVALVVMAGVAAGGIFSRVQSLARLRQLTDVQAITTVATTMPKIGPAEQDLVLPGSVQAYFESPIYARASGYIKAWSTDIGAVVKKGQLLAEIDSPDLDDQLRQAEADLATAEANDALARSTAKRWQTLLATDSVTRQETDEKVADAAAKDALVASSRANVARLRELEGYKRVVAPFDGVVTARRIDIGALINGGSGAGQELFRVADRSRLRIYVQVPQSYAAAIAVGLKAELHFAERPGRTFEATLVRTADAIEPTARTLLAEFQADNAKGELFTGSYTEVHMKLPAPKNTVRLPVNTLLFRADGLRVAKVDTHYISDPAQADTVKVSLVPITLGRDLGTEVEVVDGLSPSDAIVTNPPDSLVDGQIVRIVAATAK